MTRSWFFVFFFPPNFGSRNRTKKGKEFPEVTGQDLKEKRKRSTRFREDVCKHVRKRPPEVELTGLGWRELRTIGGGILWLFLLLGWRGRRGRGVGSPSREQVGLPADRSLGHSSVDRAPDSMTSWHLFPHSLSPEVLTPGSLSNWVYSFPTAPHNYTSLPSCVFPVLSQLQ